MEGHGRLGAPLEPAREAREAREAYGYFLESSADCHFCLFLITHSSFARSTDLVLPLHFYKLEIQQAGDCERCVRGAPTSDVAD